jgi:antitoxin component YwqK of YwqJK toxin-antitoxin module
VLTLLNGKKEGITNFFSKDGTLLSAITYKNDEITGNVTQYYPNGSKHSVMEYSSGVPDGRFTSFFENGIEQVVSGYKDGKMNGKFRVFDEFGDISMECVYQNGQKHGKNLVYYQKSQGGEVYELSFFENGLLEGEKISFYPTGEMMSVVLYVNGRAQTYPKNYSKSGALI